MLYYTCHMLLSIITMKLLFRYSKKKKNITLARMEQSFYITCRLLINRVRGCFCIFTFSRNNIITKILSNLFNRCKGVFLFFCYDFLVINKLTK
jgi:hypothetical protein